MDNVDNKKKSPKQIAAIICVVLLFSMYIGTFVVAFLDFPGWERMFWGCVGGTVGLPILLWIYIWIYKKIRQAKNQDENPV